MCFQKVLPELSIVKRQRGSFSSRIIPAVSAPVRVRGDDHLAAVVCICVVNVELQLLPFVRFDEREQVFVLSREEKYRPGIDMQRI